MRRRYLPEAKRNPITQKIRLSPTEPTALRIEPAKKHHGKDNKYKGQSKSGRRTSREYSSPNHLADILQFMFNPRRRPEKYIAHLPKR